MASTGRFLRRVIALSVGIGAATSLVAPSAASATTTETMYIIEVPEGERSDLVDTLASLGVEPDVVYDNALSGVAVSLTPAELSTVNSEMSGEKVSVDEPVQLMTAQAPAPWNLAMLDSAIRPADQAFVYPDSGGLGVRVYVVDTGIVNNNPQLAGRVLPGISLVDGDTSTVDCHGHGSHVAGTIASTSYGVAKRASVVPVRVFNCSGGGATEKKIIEGIDWAISDKPAGTVGVINMSLGLLCSSTCSSRPLITAVQRAVDANFVVVVSAGNSNRDACTFAPAAAPAAVTVGAIDRFDTEAPWSNYGPCVDLYAPGVDIASLDYLNASSTTNMSGTSMSSPHVAGAAALYIASNPGASATSITQSLTSDAATTPIVGVLGHAGSPNAQLNLSALTVGATVGVPPSAPTGLTATASGLSSIDVSWQPAVSNFAITDYLVSYRAVGSLTWTTTTSSPSLSTTERVGGLLRDTNYEFRVQAKTDVVGPWSTSTSARTLSGIPSRPSGLTLSAVSATSASLTWSPVNANGSSLTNYDVQFRLSGSTTWTTVTKPAGIFVTTTISGLIPSRGYDFRVRAVSDLGTSTWSTTATSTTLSGIPGAPAAVTMTSPSPTTLSLSWTIPNSNGSPIQDYVLEFKRPSDVTWRIFNDGVSNLPSATITGLTPGTTYSVRVSAKSDFGVGPSSTTSGLATLSGRPLKVTSLNASPSSSSVTLSWPAATANGAPITDYLIDYRRASVSTWTRFNDGVSASPGATVTGLIPNETYFVRVLAVSSYGQSTALVTSVRTLP